MVKAPTDGECPVDQIEVDIGQYLHEKAKDTTKRRGKYIIRLQRVMETKMSPKGIFNRAMKGAVSYAL